VEATGAAVLIDAGADALGSERLLGIAVLAGGAAGREGVVFAPLALRA